MKKQLSFLVTALLMMPLTSQVAKAQVNVDSLEMGVLAVTVEKINSDPAGYELKYVKVVGTVLQYRETGTNTAYYDLEGDYGGLIRVNSIKQPHNKQKYVVYGIVQLDANNRRTPFIVEKSAHPVSTSTQKLLFIVLGFCVLVILGVSIYLITQNRQSGRKSQAAFRAGTKFPGGSPGFTGQYGQQGDGDPDQVRVAFQTIKVTTDADPKTLKFIPGKLDIVRGADKGRSFRIAGYPTPEGDVVTVGRDKVTGERSYAHIQIDAQFRTVSRQHFKLVFQRPDLFVQNLSSTNPTKLNGVELSEGEIRKVQNGDIIGAGELEFQYIV